MDAFDLSEFLFLNKTAHAGWSHWVGSTQGLHENVGQARKLLRRGEDTAV